MLRKEFLLACQVSESRRDDYCRMFLSGAQWDIQLRVKYCGSENKWTVNELLSKSQSVFVKAVVFVPALWIRSVLYSFQQLFVGALIMDKFFCTKLHVLKIFFWDIGTTSAILEKFV